MQNDPVFWYDWRRLAGRLRSASQEQAITVLRHRAHRHMRTLDRGILVGLGERLGLLYPHLLDTSLLRVALNPFYPWGGHAQAGGVPAAVSDIALHRLVHATATAGNPPLRLPQIKSEIQQGTVLLQNRLGDRDRPGAFRVFHDLRSPVLLLTTHSWQDPLLDVVSHLGTLLLSPGGVLPPYLLFPMARDLCGPMIRLRCPLCRRVLTPAGLCREHGRQDHYTAWRRLRGEG